MFKFSTRLTLLLCCSLLAGINANAQLSLSGDSTSSGGGLGLRRNTGTGLSGAQGSSSEGLYKEYEIAGITVSGTKYLDEDLLIAVTGLTIGGKIKPVNDESVAKAIKSLWKQELFSNVGISISKTIGNKVFLDIKVEERPRLSKYNFRGIKKGEATELKDKAGLVKGRVVTDALKMEAIVRIRKYFSEKGYGEVKINAKERVDTINVNSVVLTFDIDKGNKTHINQVNIVGNDNANELKLKRILRSTKEMARISLYPADETSVYSTSKRSFSKYVKNFGFLSVSKTLNALDPYFRYNFFSSSKFNQKKYDDDKQSLVEYYNSLGFRDASVEKDTIYTVKNGNVNIDIKVREGRKYYFGNIEWKGNTKYTSDAL